MSRVGFSIPVGVAFCINYAVGAGSLSIPWAFQQAGSLLGISMMLIMSYFSVSAVLFLLESMARAEVLSKSYHNEDTLTTEYLNSMSHHKLEQQLEFAPLNDNSHMKLEKQLEVTPLTSSLSTSTNTSYSSLIGSDAERNINSKNNSFDVVVKQRKFEIFELCEIFLGKNGKRVYAAIISTYVYGTLWVGGTVFANALSSHFYFGTYSYIAFLTLFGFIVVPISCMELSEQVYIQVTLALCRVVMILVMISTILFAEYNTIQPFIEFPESIEPSPFFKSNLSHLYMLLPIAAYANIFHHSVPSLSEPIEDKKKLLHVFGYTVLFCLIAYSLIGTIISTYFGDYIKTSSNLNWISYSGVTRVFLESSHVTTTTTTAGDSLSGSNVPLYAQLIAAYIVCFPALDASSAFPLCAITLGNNLMSAYYGRNIHKVDSIRSIRVFFRLLAALPPLFAASWISNLGQVTSFTGISGFVMAFIFPALLGIYSKKAMLQQMKRSTKFGVNVITITTTHTYYSNWFLTSDENMYLTLAVGIFLVLFVITSLILYGTPT